MEHRPRARAKGTHTAQDVNPLIRSDHDIDPSVSLQVTDPWRRENGAAQRIRKAGQRFAVGRPTIQMPILGANHHVELLVTIQVDQGRRRDDLIIDCDGPTWPQFTGVVSNIHPTIP